MKNLRKLDALVAEHVMGIAISGLSFDEAFYHEDGHQIIERYSTDIAAAWDVVERQGDVIFERDKTAKNVRYLVVIDGVETFASTAPLAICLAALKAKGVDVSEFEQ